MIRLILSAFQSIMPITQPNVSQIMSPSENFLKDALYQITQSPVVIIGPKM